MPWVHPFTSVIPGPTGSGKSVFVRRFVHNIKHMMTPIPDRILWCYGEYQTLYGTVDGVDFQQGLPDLDTLDSREKHSIILDDLMDETDQRLASLFTKKSHHRNISVMYIVQNLFHRGKHHRTISLNAHYMVVFKNPRDVSQIMALAHQMYPQRTKYFLEAYTAATAQPHGYLVIDVKQETPDILRLRSSIFPGEEQKAYADILLYIPVYPRLIQFYERCGSSSMVSQRLKKHANELVYLQEARPCIRKYLITKADRSLVDCLCECADNILRGNVPLAKLQKEKLARNKAGLRALTKTSVSLKKKKAIIQKGGFLESLLAPIASVVAPLLSTLFQ